jgi:hypothetical protein
MLQKHIFADGGHEFVRSKAGFVLRLGKSRPKPSPSIWAYARFRFEAANAKGKAAICLGGPLDLIDDMLALDHETSKFRNSTPPIPCLTAVAAAPYGFRSANTPLCAHWG